MLKSSNFNQSQDYLINLAECSNYCMEQQNGQRIFGPPLEYTHGLQIPEKGTEVFVGKIPKDCFEDELIPLFEKPGKIFKMRLMIDFSGKNRGYCFVQYFNKQDAKRAVEMLNNYEIRPKWPIGVMLSKNNNRLFFGNLPLNINKNDLIDEVAKYTTGIKTAIYYGGQNRANGFGFVEYENHKMTALARRKFFPGSILLFGRPPKVDWAKSEEYIDDSVINKTILYVRFFKISTTEEELKQFFTIEYNEEIINVLKVKKIRHFAFIHYKNAEDAKKAYDYFQTINLSKTKINDPEQELEIKWAKNRFSFNNSTTSTVADTTTVSSVQLLKKFSEIKNEKFVSPSVIDYYSNIRFPKLIIG